MDVDDQVEFVKNNVKSIAVESDDSIKRVRSSSRNKSRGSGSLSKFGLVNEHVIASLFFGYC